MKERDRAAWPYGSAQAIGQTGEFLVWANLIAQSGGGLHVFLPMLDRGIDALIHRLADGAYIALQVKTKTALTSSEAPIAVYENHLFTDDQLVVGVTLEGDRLGTYALVADGSTFKKKAARMVTDMTENVVREIALPTGLVDNKVCAIDDTWSGLRLVVRLEKRPKAKAR